MQIKKVVVGEIFTNCYLVSNEKTKETVIIDPGDNPEKIIKAIDDSFLVPILIVNTHGHPDHLLANLDIKQKYDIPAYIHPKDFDFIQQFARLLGKEQALKARESFNHMLLDDMKLNFGGCSLRVIHTPGHSPGGVCLYDGESMLFSGDTLFADGVGRVDLPGGSLEQLKRSIDRLARLPDSVMVYPGHGRRAALAEIKPALREEGFLV